MKGALIFNQFLQAGHPFVDGNKRTGFITLWLFLTLNGFRLKVSSWAYKKHLKQTGSEIFYHREKKECDFIVKKDLKITKASQVAVTIQNPTTKKRETEGLFDALKAYKLNEGLILTLEEEERIEMDGKKIIIKPVWKWLLEE